MSIAAPAVAGVTISLGTPIAGTSFGIGVPIPYTGGGSWAPATDPRPERVDAELVVRDASDNTLVVIEVDEANLTVPQDVNGHYTGSYTFENSEDPITHESNLKAVQYNSQTTPYWVHVYPTKSKGQPIKNGGVPVEGWRNLGKIDGQVSG
jgi:hypothetical protein